MPATALHPCVRSTMLEPALPAPQSADSPRTTAAASPQSVAAVCRAVRAADHGAVDRFYRAWSGRVVAGVRAWTGRDEHFALDILHEVMLRAMSSLPVLDDEQALEAWMSTVTRRCALDKLRGERRRLARERGVAPREAREGTEGVNDELARIELAMRRLEAFDAAMLRARLVDGRELRQIAAEHGLTTGSAWGRIRRSLAALRRSLTGGAE